MRTKALILFLALSSLGVSAQKTDTTSIEANAKTLLKATAAYLQKQTEARSGWEIMSGGTEKTIGIVTSIVALIASIMAFYKKDLFTKYKGIIAIVGIISLSALLSFVLSGLIQTVIYAFFAISLVIFLFLFVGLKYIELLDKQGYGIVARLGAYFNLSKEAEPRPDFVSTLHGWLNAVKLNQITLENFDLLLNGSLIKGYFHTNFKLLATEADTSRYELLGGTILLPVHIEIRFQKTIENDSDSLLLKSIQDNTLIVTENNKAELSYHTFNTEAFNLLNVNFGLWATQTQIAKLRRPDPSDPDPTPSAADTNTVV